MEPLGLRPKVIFFDAVGTLIHLPKGVGYHYALVGERLGLPLTPTACSEAFAAVWKQMPPRAATGVPREDDDKGWWRELVERVLDRVAPQTKALDRAANKTWGTGRLTLLGDAIHPTTPNLGQGGCLAIEDAFILASCFRNYGTTEAALRNYERLRYQRTAAVTRYSRYYGAVGQWENVWARGLRKTALALVPKSIALSVMRIVFDYDATRVSTDFTDKSA